MLYHVQSKYNNKWPLQQHCMLTLQIMVNVMTHIKCLWNYMTSRKKIFTTFICVSKNFSDLILYNLVTSDLKSPRNLLSSVYDVYQCYITFLSQHVSWTKSSGSTYSWLNKYQWLYLIIFRHQQWQIIYREVFRVTMIVILFYIYEFKNN